MLIALGGIAMSFFYPLNHCQSSKKACFLQRDFATTKMNTQIILIAKIIHITQTPMRFYARMGVCRNSPLLGRKGVMRK